MKALYIGILTEGTTSRMRADTLRRLLPNTDWTMVDTDAKFRDAHRILKTLAFRLRFGPLVKHVNRQIAEQVDNIQYDLIWIDKGVYLWRKTVARLRQLTKRLVHFTPDTAFYANQSRHFNATVPLYDLLVTTKSFEVDKYLQRVDKKQLMVTTQAYDASLHKSPGSTFEKRRAVVFIGLNEPDREKCMDILLTSGIPIRLGGRGWGKFVKKHSGDANLSYLGPAVFGEQYAAELAGASIGLGLLSKRFPEWHTTRTFEIPACGTVLATERNPEICDFFSEKEVLYFNNYNELTGKLKNILDDREELEQMSHRGRKKALSGGYDYSSVLSTILNRLGIHAQA